MAGATTTTFDPVLKEFYPESRLREQLNHQAAILYHTQRKSQSVGGRRHVVALHTARGQSVGAKAEGGALPTADAETWADSLVTLKSVYATGQVSGQAMFRSRGGAHAFAQALDTEMRGKLAGLKQEMCRIFGSDGSGVLSNTGADTNTTVITVSSTKYLFKNQVVDVLTRASGAVKVTNETISAVSTANKTITIGTAITTTTADAVYRRGARNIEPMGLSGIVYNDDPSALNGTGVAVLQGLTVATYPVWIATVKGNSGTARAVGFDELQEALDDCIVAGGSVPEAFLASFPVRRKLVRDEIVDRRYAQGPDTIELEGGFSAYRFNGIPLIPDKDIGYFWKNDLGQLFGVNWSELALYQELDPSFIDETGAILKQSLSGGAYTDQFEFQIRWYVEMATHKRNAHLVVTDIDVS